MAATEDAEAVQADRPPRNRIEFKIEGHCGSMADLRNALDGMAFYVLEKEREGIETMSLASGAGYSMIVSCNPEQTDEKYKAELAAWFKRDRARRGR